MITVYAGEGLPTKVTKTMFLAGPTPRDKETKSWLKWEQDALNASDVVLFWIPREMAKMLALTTNTEYGICVCIMVH